MAPTSGGGQPDAGAGPAGEPGHATRRSRLADADIVCVGYGAWDGLWGYLHHVMVRLARRNRVLYVEGAPPEPPCRRGRHARRARFFLDAARDWLTGPRRPHGDLAVYRPPGLACGTAPMDRLDRRLLVDPVRQAARRLGFTLPILWIAFPSGVHLAGRLGERLVVYHCLDDYGCLPGLQRPIIRDLEDVLLTKADLVLAASGHLFRGVMGEHPNAFYLPVAADVEHFAAGRTCGTTPLDLLRLPRPRVGFIGALTARKVDLDLLARLARRRPTWSICLIGPVPPQEEAVFDLLLGSLDNVHRLGRRDYADLPACYAHLDAVMLPYRLNEHTRALFPPQFVEALAAGRPIIATELDSLEHYRLSPTLCRVARDRHEFEWFVEQALNEPRSAYTTLRREHARRYDLSQRMADIETLLTHSLAARRPSRAFAQTP